MKKRSDMPLGVFDSGIGGLTVLRAILEKLPEENTIYLGDTARVPYGTKSAAVVTRYALNNTRFLVQQGIKLLVVACNTASAVALPALEEALEVPVIGVIAPGATRAAELSRTGEVGVIGTEGTVASGAYEKALLARRPELRVRQRPCPLFVPLAEEGWGEHPVARQVAREYLLPWVEECDALLLGCTHYPLLIPAIQEAVGPKVQLIDSASAVAGEVALRLDREGLGRSGGRSGGDGQHAFFATDVPERFRSVGTRFLGRSLPPVQQVDLDPAGPLV